MKIQKVVKIVSIVTLMALGAAVAIDYIAPKEKKHFLAVSFGKTDVESFSPPAFTKQHEISNIASLFIDSANADVILKKGSGSQLTVLASSNCPTEQQQIIYQAKKVGAVFKMQIATIEYNPSCKMKIEVPASINIVELNTHSGEVSVNDLNLKTANIHTTAGDIKMDNSQINHLQINTVSGDMDLHANQTASVALQSVSGDINAHIDNPLLKVMTTSGDVNLHVNQLQAHSTIKTVSGDVAVLSKQKMARDAIAVNSVSGEVSINAAENAGTHQQVLSVDTVSGEVAISANNQG